MQLLRDGSGFHTESWIGYEALHCSRGIAMHVCRSFVLMKLYPLRLNFGRQPQALKLGPHCSWRFRDTTRRGTRLLVIAGSLTVVGTPYLREELMIRFWWFL